MFFKKWHLTSLSKKWLLALGGICLCFVAYDLISLPAANQQVNEPVIEVFPSQDTEQAAVSTDDFTVDAEEIKESGADFFAAYRVEREQVRAQETQMLDNIVANAEVSADAKDAAHSRKLAITTAMDQEMQIENLIKAKNFADAAVFIQDGSATVVVSGSLDEQGAVVIADLVQNVSGIGMEKLVIVQK
ncbi:MAG: SpoIIIAH-like family protein [Firmicutes bacterium]|nr:SpoIIIAH-like family protein [Bacillota bacterium]